MPELVPSSRQPRRRAVQHVHSTRIHHGPDVLPRHPDGEVVEPVAVKVAASQAILEDVSCLRALPAEVRRPVPTVGGARPVGPGDADHLEVWIEHV